MKMTHKSSLDDLIASATTTRNNVKGVQKETLDFNQLEKIHAAELKNNPHLNRKTMTLI